MCDVPGAAAGAGNTLSTFTFHIWESGSKRVWDCKKWPCCGGLSRERERGGWGDAAVLKRLRESLPGR